MVFDVLLFHEQTVTSSDCNTQHWPDPDFCTRGYESSSGRVWAEPKGPLGGWSEEAGRGAASPAASPAAAAPQTPFYFDDIPSMTGVSFSMPEFLAQVQDRIPTLAGLKFTNPDLMAYQLCLRADMGRWDVPFGCDEFLLSALALGAKGAVGSTFNFAAPLSTRLIAAFQRGDLATAQEEQFRSVQLIQLLVSYGYMGAAKAVMGMLDVPVGPARLPNGNLSAEQVTELRCQLDAMGFFEWVT